MRSRFLWIIGLAMIVTSGCADDTANLPKDLSEDQVRAMEERDRSVEEEERAHRESQN